MKQIYLDNAATSFPKAPGVGEAMADYLENSGASVNRSSYRASADVGMRVLDVRRQVCRLFGFSGSCSHAVFTSGVTQSLNMLMKGVLRPGDRLVISGMEHNAVARPARQLEKAGVEVAAAPCGADGRLEPGALAALLEKKTRMVVLQHASNVSGTIQDLAAAGELCRSRGAFLVADAAQSAGHFPFSMEALGLSAVCFTGHKGLLGPQGTGGFVLTDALAEAAEPLLAGGTGSRSDDPEMPPFLPDRFEAGTPNIPGILGLGRALSFLEETGLAALRARELGLTRRFLEALGSVGHIRVSGPEDAEARVGVVSVDFLRRDNAEAAAALEERFGILTRCGLHCAPLAHKTLGTYPEGTVRFSFGPFTAPEDLDAAAAAVRELA